MIKAIFLYFLALVVLLAPAIILGWIGWSLLDWPGLIIGIVLGLAIFVFSMNKIAAQEAASQGEEENPAEISHPESPEKVTS